MKANRSVAKKARRGRSRLAAQRQLIGYEIHDGLAQQLSAALMHFEACECLKPRDPEQAAKIHQMAVQLVRDAHAEARRLIAELRPLQLESQGILSAVEELVNETNRQGKPQVEFYTNMEQASLDPMLENAVFRIVQEGIANACRHSQSDKVRVDLVHGGDHLRIEVQDWGVGFDRTQTPQGRFGLEGIQQRARAFGGHAVIKSTPQEGTKVVVGLPMQPAGCGN
jgi:signal transduction histidine kinase